MTFKLDLQQVTFALSDVIDLVGVDNTGHGKRVARMAAACGRDLGLDASAATDLFHAALLHDCGVSSTEVHRHLLAELDWKYAEVHCLEGERFISDFRPLAHLAPIIRYHHTRWESLRRKDLPQRVKLFSNCVFLVDRVDSLLLVESLGEPLRARDAVRRRIRELSGSFFDPELVAVFERISAGDGFWHMLEPEPLERFFQKQSTNAEPQQVDRSELKDLARVFSRIVDAKSSFTHDHSQGVAKVAARIGNYLQLPEERCEMLEIAGLLHDLGKLRVPDHILEKPAPLTQEEQARMHHHSFDTYRILNRLQGMEEIAEWAAYHHEHLGGNADSVQHPGKQLGLEARILAVADIFQALAQDRPFRPSLPPDEIVEVLIGCVENGRLDGSLVDLLVQHFSECWAVASGQWSGQRRKVAGGDSR